MTMARGTPFGLVVGFATVCMACMACRAPSYQASPPPPPPPPPVYNVALSPQLAAAPGATDAVTIRAGAMSTLHFGIGERWPESVIPAQSPNPAITESTADVVLTAVLACAFCQEHPPFMRKVTYVAASRRSNVVEFTFVPRPPTTEEGDSYSGTLELAVYSDATEQLYDSVAVPVRVALEGAPTGRTEMPRPVRTFDNETQAPLAADAVLRVYLAEDRQLLVEINPIAPELRTTVGPLVMSGSGLRSFRTASLEASDIGRITTGVYVDASAISLQGDLARRLGRSGQRPTVSTVARETLTLSGTEKANLSEILAETGRMLYGRLFVDGPDGAELSKAVQALEAAHRLLGRPVRLHVRSDHLALPWQYLHPIGIGIDPAMFWGMVFDLSVERIHGSAPSTAPAGGEATPRTLLFARYGTEGDVTVTKAVEQVAQLRGLPGSNVVEVRSRDQLLAKLSGPERVSVSAVITFLHATAGSDLLGREPDEPVIQFGEMDVLTSRRLLSLRDNQTVEERRSQRYLPAAPLFILNACETGPSTIAIPYNSFQQAAFTLGAQGLVVTEVSVWVSLGHEVGKRLLTKLGSGEPVSRALSSIRRELLQERNNPLGLLYSYYGDPGATLRR